VGLLALDGVVPAVVGGGVRRGGAGGGAGPDGARHAGPVAERAELGGRGRVAEHEQVVALALFEDVQAGLLEPLAVRRGVRHPPHGQGGVGAVCLSQLNPRQVSSGEGGGDEGHRPRHAEEEAPGEASHH
jgi:hypothetical protein